MRIDKISPRAMSGNFRKQFNCTCDNCNCQLSNEIYRNIVSEPTCYVVHGEEKKQKSNVKVLVDVTRMRKQCVATRRATLLWE